MITTLLAVALASLAAVVIAMALTAFAAWRTGRVSIVDVTWGLLFVAIAWTALAVGGASAHSWLRAVLVTVWGGRLAWHIGSRAARSGQEDPRYVVMLGGGHGPAPGPRRRARRPRLAGRARLRGGR